MCRETYKNLNKREGAMKIYKNKIQIEPGCYWFWNKPDEGWQMIEVIEAGDDNVFFFIGNEVDYWFDEFKNDWWISDRIELPIDMKYFD